MDIAHNIEILKYHKSRLFLAIFILCSCAFAFFFYNKLVYEKYEEDKKDEIRRLNIIIAEEDRKRDARKLYAESFNYGMLLAFDLDGDGVELVPIESSNAFFDLDGDGFKEKVGWIRGDDGILFLDENDNNQVDSVSELFGYKDKDGKPVTGTDELKTHDLNHDNLIDKNDEVFTKLRLWQDGNQDGKSQLEEVKPLSAYGITSVALGEVTKVLIDNDNKGNAIVSLAAYFTDQKNDNEFEIANVRLRINQANSMFQGKDYKLNLEVVHLPFSRGYGNAAAWHIALSKDPELLQMMKDLVNVTGGVTYRNIDSKIEEFIYRWTGVQDVQSMRGLFDGKKLAAMETIKGTPFVDKLGKDKVSYYNVQLVKTSWEGLVKAVKAKILIQGTFKKIFNKAIYDFGSDSIIFDQMKAEDVIREIEKEYLSLNVDDAIDFIRQIASISDIFVHKLNHPISEDQFKRALSHKIGFNVE